jgi:hypothetical protein
VAAVDADGTHNSVDVDGEGRTGVNSIPELGREGHKLLSI